MLGASTSSGPTLVKGRWQLVKKVGQGAFGEIFSAVDIQSNEQVAIKFERWDSKRAVLKLEVMVLKRLQPLTENVARYVHCGHWEDYNFVVMELLGENLAELRRRRESQRFSLGTIVRLAKQMIRSIEAVHSLGYLHRDIKPSNFTMGTGDRADLCMLIDFGLTRKYRLPNGQVRPERDVAGFRGTARYASINSHLSKELSRRDDLWSLLYMLIEFFVGELPWKRLKDREEIGLVKMKHNSTELVRGLPVEFQLFLEHLQSLTYDGCPNYTMLYNLFDRLGTAKAIAPNEPWDWERSGLAAAAGSAAANAEIVHADKSGGGSRRDRSAKGDKSDRSHHRSARDKSGRDKSGRDRSSKSKSPSRRRAESSQGDHRSERSLDRSQKGHKHSRRDTETTDQNRDFSSQLDSRTYTNETSVARMIPRPGSGQKSVSRSLSALNDLDQGTPKDAPVWQPPARAGGGVGGGRVAEKPVAPSHSPDVSPRPKSRGEVERPKSETNHGLTAQTSLQYNQAALTDIQAQVLSQENVEAHVKQRENGGETTRCKCSVQ